MEMYYGVVHGNRIELEKGAHLAEGVRVEVRPRSPEAASDVDVHPACNLRTAESAFKERLRAAGRLAPVVREGTSGPPTKRYRIRVIGEAISEQIVRERR